MAYTFNSKIIIDYTKVGETDANFAVLINGVYDGTGGEPDLRTVANGGHVQNTASGGASGVLTVPADLVFSPNTDGSSKYDHEIVKYNAATGEFVAWVQCGVNSGADVTFYMVYGDSGVTISQEDVNGTWDANFEGVWHLGEPSGTLHDSTSNGNDLTSTNSPTYGAAGQIGKAVLFDDAQSEYLGRNAAVIAGYPLTMEAWFASDDITLAQRVVTLGDTNGKSVIRLSLYGSAVGDPIYGVAVNAVGAGSHAITTAGYTASTWYHAATIMTNSTTNDAYLNAANKGSDNVNITPAGIDNVRVGAEERTSDPAKNFFSGILDEVRISSTARTVDYLTTCHNNQSSPSTFYSVGAEQEVAGGPQPYAFIM